MKFERFSPFTLIPRAGPAPRDVQGYYATSVVQSALSQIGVREAGRNRGPEIDEYLRSTRTPLGLPWCASFDYWNHRESARKVGGETTCPRSASAVAAWIMAEATGSYAFRLGEDEPLPGDSYVRVRLGNVHHVDAVLRGHARKGHRGIVVAVRGSRVWTVDGNTNPEGDAEGDGVYPRELDTSMPEFVGFVRHKVIL